jgi:REP element-mobilizing transposase RayT
MVGHRTRPALAKRFPVHVTLRLKRGLPTLRRKAEYKVLGRALRLGGDRFGMRLVEYSVQRDHLHLLVEARDARSLTRGMQGLTIRMAKALNRLWRRRGSVFGDRYHNRILRTPREVRNALAYVLHNCRRHRIHPHQNGTGIPDRYSSAAWFAGWRIAIEFTGHPFPRPTVDARTWLLATGWRRHGLIRPAETPGPSPP